MNIKNRIRQALKLRYTSRVKWAEQQMYQTVTREGESILCIQMICDSNTIDLFAAWSVDNLKDDVAIALQVVIDDYRLRYGLDERPKWLFEDKPKP